MPYEFLEDVATADIAFRAWGETLEETFVAAATAVLQVMVENCDAIRPCQERRITVEHEALDLLLFNLFGCDSPKLASSRFRVIFLLIPRSLLRGSLHSEFGLRFTM